MIIQTITIECPHCDETVTIDRVDFEFYIRRETEDILLNCTCSACMEDIYDVIVE